MMTIWYSLKSVYGYFMVGAFVSMIIGSVVIGVGMKIAEKMPANALEEVRCFTGFPAEDDQCVGQQIAQAQADAEAEIKAARDRAKAEIAREKAASDARIAEAEQDLADLRAIYEGGDIISVQAAQQVKNLYIATDTLFDDPGAQSGLRSSVCYVAKDDGGPDARLTIGRLSRNSTLANSVIAPARMQEFGLVPADMATIAALCPWPSAR